MQSTENDAALVALLKWYRDMGVDTATSSDCVDWMARGTVPPGSRFALASLPPAARPSGSGVPGSAELEQTTRTSQEGSQRSPLPIDRGVISPDAGRPNQSAPSQRGIAVPSSAAKPGAPDVPVNSAARRIASGAMSMAELGKALAGFDGCPLKATAKNLCLFRGSERARLMLIGEAPGREEDLAGKPFVGPAGQLLDRILAAVGLLEADVHITNVVYWRPPGNRVPTPQETAACAPFLERQVELVAPDIVVLLGGAAAKQVLATQDGIMRLRGSWREISIGQHSCRVMPTLHPAYVLRTPASKRLIWRDFLAIKSALTAGH